MFYATRIQSVGDGVALDVNGRVLTFVGYLPVKAGDTVFTDGTFIFGNAPPKGDAAIIEETKGIPVLGNNLRGYFTTGGKFKQYKIAGTEWIANDKKIYAHDVGSNIIDAEIAEDGEIFTVEKNVVQLATNDYDYYAGYYEVNTIPIYDPVAPVNFGRVAVFCADSNDRSIFYNYPVVAFQQRDYPYAEYYGLNRVGMHVPLYYNYGQAYNSYEEGYYRAFAGDPTGYGYPLRNCWLLLRGQNLDYRKFDGKLIKQCQLIIRKGNEEFMRVDIADLLKSFEETAQAEVNLLQGRESLKHLKSRAIIRNFKILSDDSWEFLLEAEIWASNTFYERNESTVSHFPLILDTNPIQIASTVSHNHLLINFKSDNTHEKIFHWKFLYPLQLSDMYFGGYHFDIQETTSTRQGAWIIHTHPNITGGIVDNQQRYYSVTYHDYYAQLEPNAPSYNTPLLDIAEDFYFPVQDEYTAKIQNCQQDIEQWQFGGVYDKDNVQVFGGFRSTDAHKWNTSLAPLKSGEYLFGIHGDKLYKVGSDGTFEQVGNKLKNFRLRELKRMNKAKK